MLRVVARTSLEQRSRPFDLVHQLGRWHLRPLRGGPNGLVARFTQPRRDLVVMEVLGAGDATSEDIDWAIAMSIGIAGLDDDPTGFEAVVTRHPLVERLFRRFPGARLGRTPTVYETFLRTVIEQLVTSVEAIEARRRIWRKWGDRIGDTDLFAPPRAEVMKNVAPFELRPLGVNLKRALPILEGARRAKRLEAMRLLTPEEAMRRMQTLRGVGPWTANVVAMKAFGYPDGVLVGDAGAPFETTMALTGKAGGDLEMLAALEPFRPFRARVHKLFELAVREDGGLAGVPPRALPRVDPHRRYPWRTS